MSELPQDGELDRATDPEYAAISTSAVIGLVLAVVGLAAFRSEPLTVVPAAGLALSLLALRKIRLSAGVLTGRRIALVGAVLGGMITAVAGGQHAMARYEQHVTFATLESRANAVLDDMMAGRYQPVYDQMPEDFRKRQAAGADQFRTRFAPLFEGAGKLLERRLDSLQMLPMEKGGVVAPAEIRLTFENRILGMTVWFMSTPAGTWDLVGIGAEETLESQMKHPEQKPPAPIPAPFQRGHGDDH